MQRPDRGPALAQTISDYLDRKAAHRLPPAALDALREHLSRLCLAGQPPPGRGRGLDWSGLARGAGVDRMLVVRARDALRPGLAALRRELRAPPAPTAGRKRRAPGSAPVQHPEPLTLSWADPPDLHEALALHMRRHGDTAHHLRRALLAQGLRIDETTLGDWRRGRKAPTHVKSFQVLAALEARWRLPPGYFRAKHPRPAHGRRGHPVRPRDLGARDLVAWHLPDDFGDRPPGEQQAILAWIRDVALTGTTAYRRFQARAVREPYGLRFRAAPSGRRGGVPAPPRLAAEVAELVAFKTAELTPVGLRRNGAWRQATADQKVQHLAVLFGALAADPDGPRRGLGADPGGFTLAHLAFPQVLDWYLEWRRRTRGFYSSFEPQMAIFCSALAHPAWGWLTQSPALAGRLTPLAALVTPQDIAAAQADWTGACAELHAFAAGRAQEIARLQHAHHDPFETILPVLEAASPVAEYRKIADEVLRLAPCPRRQPKAAAASARAYLMIRLGLHLGFRARNLRELLVSPPDGPPRSERELAQARRAELRRSLKDGGWEVFAPEQAFKNAGSSFFAGRPLRIVLPDLAGLHGHIEDYLARHRPVLIGEAEDPQTFFVKSPCSRRASCAYTETSFYQAWRAVIQRYGLKNPWTGRGAVAGILPHGPHKVRDVLATHVLKATGSFEQASYAIQDSPRTVAAHYGRFLPQDKAAIAAEILNRAWEG